MVQNQVQIRSCRWDPYKKKHHRARFLSVLGENSKKVAIHKSGREFSPSELNHTEMGKTVERGREQLKKLKLKCKRVNLRYSLGIQMQMSESNRVWKFEVKVSKPDWRCKFGNYQHQQMILKVMRLHESSEEKKSKTQVLRHSIVKPLEVGKERENRLENNDQ